MKKAYIQPEIELLTVSALEDFLIASPSQGSSLEVDGEGANDSWLGGNDDDFVGSADEWE
jgi:hypothetical protein